MTTRRTEQLVRTSLDFLADATPVEPDLDAVMTRARADHPTGTGRRAPRLIAAAAAALLLALGIVAVSGLVTSDGRAFAVRPLEDGRLEIDLLEAAATDAEHVANSLREFGVEVTFTPMVAPEGSVGQVLGFSGSHVTGPGGEWPPPGIRFVDDGADTGADVMLIDPAVFRGTLDMQVGIPAAEGEDYDYREDAFLGDGPLAGVDCAIGEPLTAEALVPILVERDLTPTWWVVADATQDPEGGHSFAHQPYLAGVPDGEIVSAEATSADTITIGVLPDTLDAPFVATHLDEFPCDDSRPQLAEPDLGP